MRGVASLLGGQAELPAGPTARVWIRLRQIQAEGIEDCSAVTLRNRQKDHIVNGIAGRRRRDLALNTATALSLLSVKSF
jgi:hypothetical protein